MSIFPPELEANAFRSTNEYGWTRAQIPQVVEVLRARNFGILGGELWWITDTGWFMSIPQVQGPPAIYPWVTERGPGEAWADFVERGATEALDAVAQWPRPGNVPKDLPGQILYNLTWVSEAEFESLNEKKLRHKT